jgi:hypothetical protein
VRVATGGPGLTNLTVLIPGEGTWKRFGTGMVKFVPDPAFLGTSRIGYEVTDDEGNGSNVAFVSVRVVPLEP